MKNEDVLIDRLGEVFGNYLGYACALVLMAHHDNEIGYDDLINILEKVIAPKYDRNSALLAYEMYREVCDL